MERIESNVHNDNIAKNILFVHVVVQNIQCGTGDGILNESSPLGPYAFIYAVTRVGGRMGGWDSSMKGRKKYFLLISPNVPRGSHSSGASSTAC